ncbi:hypothetical protein [Ferrovibrio sp.]|uniref:hypothetical protein n=1 Tax=Ferrovibrio sp. TaxID=1917215 RepID=UPI0025C3C686|nr:hypothetical protein [Ferrovibrio sp.]MBX3454599.1 hypothetical protein [Ferrovibrio sp.]
MTDSHTQEGNELVSRIEARAMTIFQFTQNAAEKRDNVAGFRRFSTLVDDFHQAAELAEGRLTVLKTGRRDELRRYVTQIRGKILKIEIDITGSYLEGLIEAQAPLPFGSREFFSSRLKRLGELAKLLSDGPEADGSTGQIVSHMREMLQILLNRAPEFEVFERDSNYRPLARSAPGPKTRGGMRGGSGPAVARTVPVQANDLPPVIRLEHRDDWGRVFLSKGSFELVTKVCRVKNISLDQIAGKLGITRVSLTLILNGQDPIARNTLDVLHRALNGVQE